MLGMCGQCFFRTRHANGSISDCHKQVMPARSKPRSKPPMPVNKLPNVNNCYPITSIFVVLTLFFAIPTHNAGSVRTIF